MYFQVMKSCILVEVVLLAFINRIHLQKSIQMCLQTLRSTNTLDITDRVKVQNYGHIHFLCTAVFIHIFPNKHQMVV